MGFDFDIFIAQFITTMIDMAGLTAREVSNNEETHENNIGDISGFIDIISENKSARILLKMTSNDICNISTEISGREVISLVNPINTDVFGEILNISVGSSQKHSLITFDFFLPEVLKGQDHEIMALADGFEAKKNLVIEGVIKSNISLYLVKLNEQFRYR